VSSNAKRLRELRDADTELSRNRNFRLFENDPRSRGALHLHRRLLGWAKLIREHHAQDDLRAELCWDAGGERAILDLELPSVGARWSLHLDREELELLRSQPGVRAILDD
jgi:hypothetical protein